MIAQLTEAWLKLRNPVYRGYSRPKKFDNNLVVIGAGSAGLVSAYIAQVVEAKVTLIESGRMGGDCLNTGCVPSKALIHCAQLISGAKAARELGVQVPDTEPDFASVIEHVLGAVETIAPHDSVERYESLGVHVIQGHAKLIDPWRVEVLSDTGEKQIISSRSIVLATGAAPLVPDLPGLAQSGYLTTESLWQRLSQLSHVPKQLLMVGGGPVSCELAQAMSRLGSQVTLVAGRDRLLSAEDPDVSEFAKQRLIDSGVKVILGQRLVGFQVDSAKLALIEDDTGVVTQLTYDEVLLALGRSPRLQNLGLEQLGFAVDKPLQVDAYLRTRYPNIYAAGDVIGPYQLTHVASHEAWYASVNAMFGAVKKFKADYRVIPWTTFLDPEIARVGLSECGAREAGIEFEVTRFDLRRSDRAITEDKCAGFVKVLTKAGSDKVLGAVIVAPRAAEMLSEFVLAMKHGLGLKKIMGTIHSYPTWSEAAKSAASDWQQQHKPDWALKVSSKYHQWMRG